MLKIFITIARIYRRETAITGSVRNWNWEIANVRYNWSSEVHVRNLKRTESESVSSDLTKFCYKLARLKPGIETRCRCLMNLDSIFCMYSTFCMVQDERNLYFRNTNQSLKPIFKFFHLKALVHQIDRQINMNISNKFLKIMAEGSYPSPIVPHYHIRSTGLLWK